MQLCANITMLYNEVDFLQRYQCAADDGFTAVECLFPYAYSANEVNAMRLDAGVKQLLFNTSAGNWQAGERGMACHPDKAVAFRDSVSQALDYAVVLDTQLVHVMAGLLPADLSLAEAEQVYVENLRWAAQQAHSAGVTLTLEAINPLDMPAYMLTTQQQANQLRQRIGADNVKLQFDFYHCQKYEHNSLQQIAALCDQVAHIQIAGVPDRHEPNTGDFDYTQAFALLTQLGYRGGIGCEYRPKGSTRRGLAWRQDYAVK